MPIYLVGLGLGSLEDVTVAGLKLIREADEVYLEHYTSILSSTDTSEFETFYKKAVILADRDFIEGEGLNNLIERAKSIKIAILVVGDPFCATTHSDLVLRARHKSVEVVVVHNASIVSAIACTGLQIYRFGETISIPLWTETWKPESFFQKLQGNADRDLHTLCLLDIKVKERTIEGIMKNKDIFHPPRFMNCIEGLEQLVASGLDDQLVCVGVARVGKNDQKIVSGLVSSWLTNPEKVKDILGGPLHSLVICAKNLHEMEMEFIKEYWID
jgi:diphthine methyl ester synthase